MPRRFRKAAGCLKRRAIRCCFCVAKNLIAARTRRMPRFGAQTAAAR
jgi:hypothetical protein